jgi:hypothetical protein
MAIGDNYNDIEMLAFAGCVYHGECFGRASPQRLGGHVVERPEWRGGGIEQVLGTGTGAGIS